MTVKRVCSWRLSTSYARQSLQLRFIIYDISDMIYHISYIDTVRQRNNYQLSGAYDGEEGLFMAPLYFLCAAITAASMATAQIVAALHVCQVSFSKAPHCAGTEFKKNGHKKTQIIFWKTVLNLFYFAGMFPFITFL